MGEYATSLLRYTNTCIVTEAIKLQTHYINSRLLKYTDNIQTDKDKQSISLNHISKQLKLHYSAIKV